MPEAIAARLIGSLFVERGLVSESQIRVALEIQRETGDQLGKILVEQFGVPRKELTRVVADQWREVYGDGVGPDAAAGETWRPLGEIFVTRGFVSEDELDEALRRQRQTGERLGEALVSLGVISKFELAGALGEQTATLRAADDPETAEAAGAKDNVVSLQERLAEVGLETDRSDDLEQVAVESAEPAATAPPAGDADTVAVEPEHREEAMLETPELALDEPVELELGAARTREDEEPLPIVQPEVGVDQAAIGVESVAEELVGPAIEEGLDSVAPESIDGADEWAAALADDHEGDADVEVYELEVATFVAYASTPKGYRLVASEGELPDVGKRIALPDVGELIVTRIGRSPLPLDTRVCVFVEQPLAPVGDVQPA